MIKEKLRESEKKLSCNFEKIKEDKDKREFIKKSLFGLGTAGVVVGVLASPFGSSIATINTTSLTATSTHKVANWNADLLDGQHSTYYRCTDCSWTCHSSCLTACTGRCTAGCTGCQNVCTGCSGTS